MTLACHLRRCCICNTAPATQAAANSLARWIWHPLDSAHTQAKPEGWCGCALEKMNEPYLVTSGMLTGRQPGRGRRAAGAVRCSTTRSPGALRTGALQGMQMACSMNGRRLMCRHNHPAGESRALHSNQLHDCIPTEVGSSGMQHRVQGLCASRAAGQSSRVTVLLPQCHGKSCSQR